MANPERFIIKDPELPVMLMNLQKAGKKTFLCTNSAFEYTNSVLTYLLGKDYRNYFTYIIVDSHKPLFFTERTGFREVDVNGELLFTSV